MFSVVMLAIEGAPDGSSKGDGRALEFASRGYQVR